MSFLSPRRPQGSSGAISAVDPHSPRWGPPRKTESGEACAALTIYRVGADTPLLAGASPFLCPCVDPMATSGYLSPHTLSRSLAISVCPCVDPMAKSGYRYLRSCCATLHACLSCTRQAQTTNPLRDGSPQPVTLWKGDMGAAVCVGLHQLRSAYARCPGAPSLRLLVRGCG